DALYWDSGDFGDPRADSVAVRADPWRLAHDGEVEVRDASTPRAHAFGSEGQEPFGGSAPPLRIGRREMNPDVAVGQRSEDGIDGRKKTAIGVRMAAQAIPMRDAHTPEHHMITVSEAVHVEAESGAHVAQGCELRGLCARKIVVRREFDVLCFTSEGGDLQPRPFGERGVVGE